MMVELELLMALDRGLASREGLQLVDYCEQQGISLRTARRYIRKVREIGQSVESYEYDDGTSRYHYARGVKPLFTCNLKR